MAQRRRRGRIAWPGDERLRHPHPCPARPSPRLLAAVPMHGPSLRLPLRRRVLGWLLLHERRREARLVRGPRRRAAEFRPPQRRARTGAGEEKEVLLLRRWLL